MLEQKQSSDVAATLAERGKRYGEFIGHARVTQAIKDDMRAHPKWMELKDDAREALDMVAHKIGRVINGDQDYADSWHDICGYSKLVEDRILREEGIPARSTVITGNSGNGNGHS